MLPSIPDDLQSISEFSREGSVFSLNVTQHSLRRHRSERTVSAEKLRVDQSRQDSWLDRTRQRIHCSFFCGGRRCKFERWSALNRDQQEKCAIQGLISNWVGEDLIASQRPSSSLFPKFSLIQQFKAKKVSAVVNLQEKGEHRNCGPDGILTSTGYSYSANDDLMAKGITCYEYPWPDMTAPEQDVVLRSIQVIDNHVRTKGKVLVHCHAGLGRTGLLIACYYVYRHHMSSWEAIHLVRGSRPGAIQTPHQFKFICNFEQHLWRLSQAFCMPLSDAAVDVDAFVERQRRILHGKESDSHRHTPMFLHKVLCRLINLVRFDKNVAESLLESFSLSSFPDSMALNQCRVSINRLQFNVNETYNEVLLAFLVVDWFRGTSKPALSSEACRLIVGFQQCCTHSSSSPSAARSSALARTSPPTSLHAVRFVPSTASELQSGSQQESNLSSAITSSPTVAYNDDHSAPFHLRSASDSKRLSSGSARVSQNENTDASLERSTSKGEKDDSSFRRRTDGSLNTLGSSHQSREQMSPFSPIFTSQSFSSSDVCVSCSISEMTIERFDKDALNETNVMSEEKESEIGPGNTPRRSTTKPPEHFLAPLPSKSGSTVATRHSMESMDTETSNPPSPTSTTVRSYPNEEESATVLPALLPCASGCRQGGEELIRSARNSLRSSLSAKSDSRNEREKKSFSPLPHLEGAFLPGSDSNALRNSNERKNAVRIKGKKDKSETKPTPAINPLVVPLLLESSEMDEIKVTRKKNRNDGNAPNRTSSVNNSTQGSGRESAKGIVSNSATLLVTDPSGTTLPYMRSSKMSAKRSISDVPIKNKQGGEDEKNCEIAALTEGESPASQRKKRRRAKRTTNAPPPNSFQKSFGAPHRTSFQSSSGESKGEWGGELRQSAGSGHRKVSLTTNSKTCGVNGEYPISFFGSASNSVSPVFTSAASRRNSRTGFDRSSSQKDGNKGGNAGNGTKRSPSPAARGHHSRHEKSKKKRGKSEGNTESTSISQSKRSLSPVMPALGKSLSSEQDILKCDGRSQSLYYFNTVLTPAVRHTIGMVLSFVECICSSMLNGVDMHEGNKALESPPSLERRLEGERHHGTLLQEQERVRHPNPFSWNNPPHTDSSLTVARPDSASTTLSVREILSNSPGFPLDRKRLNPANVMALKRHAYDSLIDSFTHESNALERSYSPEVQNYLCDFFMECGSIIGDAYFNPEAPSASKAASRSVNRVALASKKTLEETRVSDACLPNLPLSSPSYSNSFSRIPFYTHCEADTPLNRSVLPKRSSAKMRKLMGAVLYGREVQAPEQTNRSTSDNILQGNKNEEKLPLSSAGCVPDSITAKRKAHSHLSLPSLEKTSNPPTSSALLPSAYCKEGNPLEGIRHLSPIEATSTTVGSSDDVSFFSSGSS